MPSVKIILKIFTLNSLATFVRIIFNLLLIKTIAGKLGTNGMAYYGQLSSLISIVSITSTGGITNGIVKFTAENINKRTSLLKYLKTANQLSFIFSILNVLVLIIFSKIISRILFNDESFYWVICLYASSIFFYVLSTIIIAVLNGYSKFEKIVIINVSFIIISSVFSIFLTLFFGLNGALTSIAISQFFQIIIIFLFIKKKDFIYFFRGIMISFPKVYKDFLIFSIMALFSAICVPFTLLIVKRLIIQNISINDAGLYEGVLRISNIYLGIISSTLTFYFLPKLSHLKTNKSINSEIFFTLKYLIIASLLLLSVIYVTRSFTINIFLSSRFAKISDILGWQLIGDFFRICSYIFAILLIAKKQIKIHIIIELLFALVFGSLTFYLIKFKNLSYVSFSYAISTFVVLIALLFFHSKTKYI